MMKKHIWALGSGIAASVLMTGATFAKAPPKVTTGGKAPVAIAATATVSHVSSSAVVFKTAGPANKTMTVTASQVSAHSALSFTALTSGEQVSLQKTSSGWMIAKAPTPPATGVVTKVGSSTISVKEMGPGNSGSVKTITLGHHLTVKDGSTTESASAIKVGDHVSVQGNSSTMTINIMPTPPVAAKIVSVSNGNLVVKMMQPGQSGTKTYALSSVKVMAGPNQSASVSKLKAGETIAVQSTSSGVTVHVMPTPPKAGKPALSAPKPGHAPKLKAPSKS